MINSNLLNLLVCPRTKQNLHVDGNQLITESHDHAYNISPEDIPLFAEEFCSSDAERQRLHYQKVHKQYVENLSYPHTQEYSSYLDAAFLKEIQQDDLINVLELCCGDGELLKMTDIQVKHGIGIDISPEMLSSAKSHHKNHPEYAFIQGDATNLPLRSNSFDSVFIFGGIHHVPDREKLFSEVHRVLKPGGKLFFREPVSDFFLWRWLRAIIYQFSPALDEETERPLLWDETIPLLKKNGLQLTSWETYGFLGFCLLMNSDILVFNRLFKYVPFIRQFTKGAIALDDITRKLPFLSKAGAQVIGVATKKET